MAESLSLEESQDENIKDDIPDEQKEQNEHNEQIK